jgi:putative redox protein
MQAMLLALGACTAADVVVILKKQRQSLTSLTINVTGQRGDQYPKPWETAQVIFEAKGNVDFEKLKSAVELSSDKYEKKEKERDELTTMFRQIDIVVWRER